LLVTSPLDEIFTSAARRSRAFDPTQIKKFLHFILVVVGVRLLAVFRQKSRIKVVIFGYLDLLDRTFRKQRSRFEAAHVHPGVNTVPCIPYLELDSETVMDLFNSERAVPKMGKLAAQARLNLGYIEPHSITNFKASLDALRQFLPLLRLGL
jgi:hypothetical protein